MKNYMRINGQLLQTNKKWSHLKERQKNWIMETARQENDRFVRERGKLPVHGSKQQLIERMVFMAQGYAGRHDAQLQICRREIVHTVVDSFGPVTVAPLTAATSGLLLTRKKK